MREWLWFVKGLEEEFLTSQRTMTKKIGVVGGGQLAWMMGKVASSLDVELFVQTPNQSDPAVGEAQDVVLGAIADAEATKKLASLCDVVTFENEFIDLAALQALADSGVIFRPSLKALAPLLDKYDQRTYLQSIGLPVPEFVLLQPDTELTGRSFPQVLKARRHGYDGQGTFVIKDTAELKQIWHKYDRPSMLLESFIPFAKELAIMVARNQQGDIVTYPVVETVQKEQVCRWVFAPANISAAVAKSAKAIATKLVAELEYVGVLGIEFFLTEQNQLLINEIAPRTHNSGHYSLDACDISQFEMQLRAVADLPLVTPKMKSFQALMVNLLGYETSISNYSQQRKQITQIPRSFLRWYDKSQSRPGRKLGHVTVLLDESSKSSIEKIAITIDSLWHC